MKMNRILAIILVSVMLINSNIVHAMESIEGPLKKEAAETISLKHKVIGATAVAALLGISAAFLGFLIHKFGKFGLAVVAVAQKNNLLYSADYMKTLLYAKNHDDQNLKRMLMSFNVKFFGNNWDQVRSPQVDDFVKMNIFAFIKKYSLGKAKDVDTILNLYSGASDLYFRASSIKTYLKGAPSRSQQVKYMEELDRKLGI